jgi:C-terminal processing protease CtpA/Prc
VHNILSGLQRDVVIQPNSTWGGEGLLGLVIRYDTLKQADEHCIHILDVFPRSPAHKAGLISYEDYLLGTDDTVLKSYEDLEKLLSAQKTVTLVVFNAINRGVRDVRKLVILCTEFFYCDH